ncbi:MAG TPA: pyrroloquinoline quinone biosynthesis protein PqqB [Candidatus Acidoferrales bacterium]|jgi:pyrroloquinoline quinone biosynthesis protein B|nr:pyrroloquinoline quinone biosynthesis protein PqqB [Candidatus Acidoferrales bacterium]
MRIKVLGSAAGGGFPQWNCGCSNCDRARRGLSGFHPRTQAQVAVSPCHGSWFLLNASPDLRQQLLRDPDFAPAEQTRGTPISAIILMSADVDGVMGLLHMREFQPLKIYATASVLRVLKEENSLFRSLERSAPPVEWEALRFDRPISIDQRAGEANSVLTCEAVPLGGDYPDYVGAGLRKDLAKQEAVIGLEFVQEGKKFFYAPSLSGRNDDWKCHAKESDLAFLDGTFWADNELIDVRGSGKTAREIGHVPLSGPEGLLAQFPSAGKDRRVLIHLNNTNPVLDEESAANQAVRDAGWEVAYDGMEFEL